MLVVGVILLLGVSTRAYHLKRNNYEINIENNILKSIYSNPESSEELDLSGLGLQAIDENVVLEDFDRIKNLSLANNNLRLLSPLIFWQLMSLEHLSLANNSLSQFQYAFYDLPNFRTLDISNNGIIILPKGSLYGLTENTEILINGNQFGGLKASHFEKPFSLLELCMIDGIVHFVKLFDVDGVERMKVKICQSKLRPFLPGSVSLGMEGIKGVLKGWYRLEDVTVTDLDLQLNEINEITSDLLNDLPEDLTRVNLAWNNIKILRNDVINNEFLRELDLSENPISLIEDEAFLNTKLTNIRMPSKFVKE